MEMFIPTVKRQNEIFLKNAYETKAWQENQVVCGIDEVGRGCLAGSVVTAAVILPPGKKSRLIKDSKLLDPQERQKANDWILEHCWYGYGMANHRIIDKYNIYQATLVAMKRALVNLMASCPLNPSAILIDAMPLKLADTAFKEIPVHYFPKGEALSISIAAASILAKVKRDAILTRLGPILPGYGLDQHKGYSTASHMKAVNELDKSIIHRNSFLTKILIKEATFQAASAQQNMFEPDLVEFSIILPEHETRQIHE